MAKPQARIARTVASLCVAGTLVSCAEVDPQRAQCAAGLWQSDKGEYAAVNAREDGTVRLTAFGGRVWTFALQNNSWSGGRGQDTAAGDTALDDKQCAGGDLKITHRGIASHWRRVAVREQSVNFVSKGVTLTGKLVLPADATVTRFAVLLHGSEKRSAIASHALQYLLPSQGIAAFVFDKRGTGSSGGGFTKNFDVLAADAIAAFETARRLLPDKSVEGGFLGGSQGAWIGPLAASRAPSALRVNFVIAAYGLAQSPMEEDREEVLDDLRRKGFTDSSTLAKVREITDATAEVLRSNFTRGFERLDALKEKYGREPWYDAIDGEFTGFFLGMPSWLLAWVGPLLADDTSLDYEPAPVIERLAIPMLWVLAGDDTEAPSGTTLEILRQMQARGRRAIDIALFPAAEHVMAVVEQRNGARALVGITEGYFELLSAWIRDRSLAQRPEIQTFEGDAASVYSLPR
jgi:hypothetical protein